MTKKELCKAIKTLISGYESEGGEHIVSLTVSDAELFTVATKTADRLSSSVYEIE